MRFPVYTALTAALGLVSTADALRILMGNDDGFGSGNLRELYKLLVEAGHDGTMVRPRCLQIIDTNTQQLSSSAPPNNNLAKAEQSSGPRPQTSRSPPSTISFQQAPHLLVAILQTTTSGTTTAHRQLVHSLLSIGCYHATIPNGTRPPTSSSQAPTTAPT